MFNYDIYLYPAQCLRVGVIMIVVFLVSCGVNALVEWIWQMIKPAPPADAFDPEKMEDAS